MADKKPKNYPDVVAAHRVEPSTFGVGERAEIDRVFNEGRQTRTHRLEQTPMQQAENALRMQDVGALTRALQENPSLGSNNYFMGKLKQDPFYQANSQEIMASLRQPDPNNRDAPLAQEQQKLISQLENLSRPASVASYAALPAPRGDAPRSTQQPQFNAFG